MIFGIGCDIVNVERLNKDPDFIEHFISRSFSDEEKQLFWQRKFANENQKLLYAAKRFAAKEAVAKAIGTGFRNGLFLSDITIINNEQGKPEVNLSDKASSYLKNLIQSEKFSVFLSLSDDYPFAQAMAVIEI